MEIWDPYDWSIVFENLTHDKQAVVVLCIWVLALACVMFAWSAAKNRKRVEEAERKKEIDPEEKALLDWVNYRVLDGFYNPVKKEPVNENIFADVYKMDNATVPKHGTLQMVICPRCNWKGGLDETVNTYGHTICPYCHEEFKEIVR